MTENPMSDATHRPRNTGGSDPNPVVDFPRTRAPKRLPHNLPLQLSSFVGREREVAEVKRLLESTRLLTLTGAGGSGKTRLALRVAQDLVEGIEDGVWLVELASLSDPDLVAQAVAQALGVREQPDRPLEATLVDALCSRQMLLMLDNCEHLIEGCARFVATMLATCPRLRVLATSREALEVAGEVTWVVPSLSVPGPRFAPEGLEGYESARLFIERARQRDPSFDLSARNAKAVADICQRLDGIPLAIELAAVRVGVLSAGQIAERLDDSLRLLSAGGRSAVPRHRRLGATLDWSFELLGEPERALFRRLSVFAGGWTLEAAEAVGTGEGMERENILDLLGGLVDKSLVVAEAPPGGAGGALRYRMLEPLRQYGRQKLESAAAGSGEAEQVRRRHADHYLALAERAEPELLGADQGRWFQRLRTEVGNLRGALSWSLEHGQGERAQELRLRLVAALWRFWDVQGFEEGKRWLQAVLERDPGGFPAVRAKALGGLGFILTFQQDYARAIAALEEAIALYKELGDESGAAFALANFGWAVLHGDYRERVPGFVQEGEALMKGDLDAPARAYLRILLGCAAQEKGNLDSAVSQLEEALALCRELGDLRTTAMSLFILGNVEIIRGDFDRGVTLFEEGAGIARELRDLLGTAYYVWVFGKVNALRRNPIQAARLWGAAESLREQMGMSLSHFDLAQSGYEQDLAAVRSTLSEASFDAAWTEGQAMSPEQAIEYALGAVEEPAAAPPTMSPVAERTHSDEKPAEMAGARATTTGLRIFALGPARVERGGRALTASEWTYARPRELFFYLLSHPSRSKAQIGLALWPDASPSQLRGNFHITLHRLRKALGGAEWIVFEKGHYAFNRSLEYYFDVEVLESELVEARRLIEAGEPQGAIHHLEEAIELYRGDFLEDLPAEGEWASERQRELRRSYQEALSDFGGLLFEEGRYAEAAEAHRKLIAHDAYLEEAHRGLMRCQAALGERGQAIRHYQDLAKLLDEELGTPPAPETRALYESLRRSDETESWE